MGGIFDVVKAVQEAERRRLVEAGGDPNAYPMSPAVQSVVGAIRDIDRWTEVPIAAQGGAIAQGLVDLGTFPERYRQANLKAGDVPDPTQWAPEMAATMAGGGTGRILVGGGVNEVGIFGGRLAKTADMAALKRAEELAASGAPREAIWNETGWFQGADGKWRFEIDDSAATVDMGALPQAPSSGTLANQYAREKFGAGDFLSLPPNSPQRKEALEWANEQTRVANEATVPLSSAVQHPDLYAAYDMGDVQVGRQVGGMLQGSQFGNTVRIGGEPILGMRQTPSEVRGTTLHELQHKVQDIEGFARGGLPADFTYQNSPLFGERRSYESASDAYRRLGGEVEARNAQARMNMDAAGRQDAPPWTTEDVPRDQQILRFGEGPSASIKAYHGSPYDFDQFDMSKIGTGEGAQAYGHATNAGMSFKDTVAALRAKYPNVKLDVATPKDGPAAVSRIVVPEGERNQGIGSAIMAELTRAADDNGVTLALSPVSDFGGSVTKLRDFYSRFGFVKNSGRAKDFTTRETYIRAPTLKDTTGKPVPPGTKIY